MMNKRRGHRFPAILLRYLYLPLLLTLADCTTPDKGKHLFILSGQSNMVGLDPDESFTPAVEAILGEDNVLIAYYAKGGQPIRRWYKDWQSTDGQAPEPIGDLYDSLMTIVNNVTAQEEVGTVTFVWMQGERDAREQHGAVYAASLQGLIDQLAHDLDRQTIHFVIGRLSDFDMENSRYPHWTMVREAQVTVAERDPFGAWVDTDDLNDGINRSGDSIANDLHYAVAGYHKLGARFADAAVELIQREPSGVHP